jgi:hypothetical protein
MAEEKSLHRVFSLSPAGNGFVSIAFHPPSFSLFRTWEIMFNRVLRVGDDFYFRSISGYYGLLILILQGYWLSKISKYLPLLGAAALMSGTYFFSMFVYGHLDSYRIFLLMVSWILACRSLATGGSLPLALFGIFAGLAAFSHALVMFIVIISWFVFTLFQVGRWQERIWNAACSLCLVLIFGGLHYVIDSVSGNKWLFRIMSF